MEKETKKVIIPLDEYEGLLKDKEALQIAKEELKKDCKERGLYVEYIMHYFGDYCDYFTEHRMYPHLNLISKDTALVAANNEIKQLSEVAKSVKEEKDKEISRLKNRGLWKRILNKD